MSMGYPLPPEIFNASEWARNKVLRANQGRQNILQEFLSLYQDFWGVTLPGRGSRHTPSEMQDAVNNMPPDTASRIMEDLDRLRNFIVSVAPNALDIAYHDTAFVTTILKEELPDATERITITIGQLRPAWHNSTIEDV